LLSSKKERQEYVNEVYRGLTHDQMQQELDRLNELYWNAVDYLGSLTASRATLMNEMKEQIWNENIQNSDSI
jgi:DNA segregation ATPase FtsK/SpoIIIE-like protein